MFRRNGSSNIHQSRTIFRKTNPARAIRVAQKAASITAGADRSLSAARKHAIPADEVFRSFLQTVDPAPQPRDLLPAQNLIDRVQREIADHVLLIVVLAAENTLAM